MTTCPKNRFLHYALDWKGFEMDRDEISLKTKTKVSLSLGGKEITSATNAQIRNAAYARKQKRVTTATATKTPPNEKLNEWKNGFASAFGILVHFLAVFCKKIREITKFYVFWRTRTAFAKFSYLSLEFNAVITHVLQSQRMDVCCVRSA